MNAAELRYELRQFTGSEQIFHHALVKSFNYTEGMRFVFQKAGNGAYWLSDILATEPAIKRGVVTHGFCVAVLDVKGSKAKLVVARDASAVTDASGETVTGYAFDQVVFQRDIDLTDFPEGLWKFYLTHTQVGSSEVVLAMLPSEY